MRPQLNAPFILDFELAEQALNVQWVNGKPLFRQPFQLVGGNGTSTAASILNTIMETLVDATWAGFVTGSGWFANAGTTSNGIVVDLGTGLITVRHTGENLTGQLVFCVLQYTKV